MNLFPNIYFVSEIRTTYALIRQACSGLQEDCKYINKQKQYIMSSERLLQ